jgi:hypothetical protein
VSAVRFVGGHYGNATEENLIRELAERGPVAVALYADADLALYGGGLYSPQHDYWTRVRGRTVPAFDYATCHSGCAPPHQLEYQQVNLGATLVGYGSEAQPDGSAIDFWVLQLPLFGSAWGEGGYARVLRSEAAIFDAVAIDPMV